MPDRVTGECHVGGADSCVEIVRVDVVVGGPQAPDYLAMKNSSVSFPVTS